MRPNPSVAWGESGSTVDGDSYTLEQLAAASGMTVRNLRSYQTRGLLAAPRRSGRRSIYGREHLQRLQAIQRARARGASLTLIVEHLSEGGSLDGDSLARRWVPPAQRVAVVDLTRGTGGGRDRSSGTADLGAVLTRIGAQRTASVTAHVDELVAAGVLHRDGLRLVTARDLASAVVALERQGLPVEQSLQVASSAVRAAQLLGTTLNRALERVERRDAVREDLLALAIAVLTRVVAASDVSDVSDVTVADAHPTGT
jgi:DNA-binding transcriptional MerR regulator